MTAGEAMGSLFDPGGLTPHGFCLSWEPSLLTLTVLGDAMTAFAYLIIPVQLLRILLAGGDLGVRLHRAPWVVAMFAAFILLCGLGHALDVLTLFYPAYWLAGAESLLTGMVSLFTAAMLNLAIVPARAAAEP